MGKLNLLPCPFCGGEVSVKHVAYVAGVVQGYWVGCDNIDCYTDIECSTYAFETEAEAIEVWNRRTEKTCRMERIEWRDTSLSHEIKRHKYVCSRCGLELEADLSSELKYPYQYCPKCGAKAVD